MATSPALQPLKTISAFKNLLGNISRLKIQSVMRFGYSASIHDNCSLSTMTSPNSQKGMVILTTGNEEEWMGWLHAADRMVREISARLEHC